jgi:hypothetical protein
MADDKSFVFVMRGSADIDQMAPVMWQSLEMGHPVVAIVASEYKVANDFRLNFLATYPRFTLRHLPSAAFAPSGLKKYGRVRWNAMRTKRMLRSINAGMCIFEWGDGVADIAKANGVLSRTRRALFTDFVLQAQLSAKELGIPTVALPHGHSTKLNLIRSKQVEQALASSNGKLPFANRDSFDAYVFCADYHRDVIVGNSTMSGNNVEVWGSARFSREWLHVLYRIAPQVQLPALNGAQHHRVLFFLPKWHNMVDRGATISLLHALGKLANIQFVISGHVRGDDTQLSASETAEIAALPSVVFAPQGANSVSLIRECNHCIRYRAIGQVVHPAKVFAGCSSANGVRPVWRCVASHDTRRGCFCFKCAGTTCGERARCVSFGSDWRRGQQYFAAVCVAVAPTYAAISSDDCSCAAVSCASFTWRLRQRYKLLVCVMM